MIACVAGARRGRGIGEIRCVLERKGSAQDGGGSANSKPIIWLVFHGRFLIENFAIGQSQLVVNQVIDQFFRLVRINLLSFNSPTDYSQTPDLLLLHCLSFFLCKNADRITPINPKCFQFSQSQFADGKLQSQHPYKIV